MKGDVLTEIKSRIPIIHCFMYKHLFAFFLSVVFLILDVNAQESPRSKWSFQLSHGMGTAVLQNDFVPSRLESTSVEALVSYRFNDQTELATGLSLMGLNGNSFNELGNYNQTRGILLIPLILQNIRPLTGKAQLITSAGVFANHTLEDTRQYVDDLVVLSLPTWSMGVHAGLGASYDLSSCTSLGVEYRLLYAFADQNQHPEILDSRMSSRSVNLTLRFRLK